MFTLLIKNKQNAMSTRDRVGDDTYKITRNLEKYQKKLRGKETTEVKTELDFTKYALGNIAESKNGTTNETDENIRTPLAIL